MANRIACHYFIFWGIGGLLWLSTNGATRAAEPPAEGDQPSILWAEAAEERPTPWLALEAALRPATLDQSGISKAAKTPGANASLANSALRASEPPSLDPASAAEGQDVAAAAAARETESNISSTASDLVSAAGEPLAVDATTASTGLVQAEPGISDEGLPQTPAERSSAYVQAAFLQQGDDTSARLRGSGIYVLSPSVFAGATVDLTTGESFADSRETGLSLNELYLTASPANVPELRFTVGLMDLTSYFDRNSFAKDAVTHFFNPVFQTNPALSAANISSRPGALVNWTPFDQLSLTAAAFSAEKGLGDFSLDSFAGEVGVRWGNAILRGTYVSSRDAGNGDGFQESFAVPRPDGSFGVVAGDREESFGLNAEVFVPDLNLGFFGRLGWYTNPDLGLGGTTYSFGLNALDVFWDDDRLGLAYGRQLSNQGLQQTSRLPQPDVLELFYDVQVAPRLRAGVSLQQRNGLSDTYLGFRVRYDHTWSNFGGGAE